MNNKNIEKRTPLSVVMDMTKSEIGNFTLNLMQKNNIPPFLMCYIIKSALSDFQQMAMEKLSDEFTETQRAFTELQKVEGSEK